MPRHPHPEDGMVYTCPECDSSAIYRRKGGGNPYLGDHDDDFSCQNCKTTFNEPDERPAKQEGGHRGYPGVDQELLERVRQKTACDDSS